MVDRVVTHAAPPAEVDSLLREGAFALGVDIVGVAPVERFEAPADYDEARVWGYPPSGFSPRELLPSARNVVVLAIRQLAGVVESAVAEAETTFAFGNFGYVHLNREMNAITYALARWLEARSWTALPLGAALASRRAESGRSAAGDPQAPLYGIFSVKRAAVLAGVGRRARNGLVATERFGPKVRLGVLLTDAPLIADPVLEGDPCPPKCRICMDACPTGALSAEGRVDHVRCFSDCGRRGATLEDAWRILREQYTSDAPGADYLPGEHAGIDSFGNRRCRVACMAFCPLGEVQPPHLIRLRKGWLKSHPRVVL